MVMPISCTVEDGPAILQLQKWQHLRFQPDLSEFREAYISPTRQLLLLLSEQCEAMLLSLIAGKETCRLMNKADSGRFSSEGQEPCSPEQATSCPSDLLEDIMSRTKPSKVESDTPPDRSCSSAFEYCPVISGVKSLAWGVCGDAYGQLEDSGFNELLVVSGDYGITIHAFRCPQKDKKRTKPEVREMRGKWVEWGPTVGRSEADGESTYISSLKTSSKNWFRTFFTEIDTIFSDGKWLARFPAKSSFPQSAEAVSFSINDSTLLFLDSLASTGHIKMGKENVGASEEFGDQMPVSETSNSHEADNLGNSFKCLRVFSSSSHRLIGLVLTFPENALIKDMENHLENSSKILVVVIMIDRWGFEWSFSVNLEDLYPGPGPSPEWVDFQFSDNFLVCLAASGLIGIWDLSSGNLLAHFDVLQSCRINLKLPLTRITSVMADFDAKIDQSNKVNINKTCVRDLIGTKTFKRLMVTSQSLLLAIIDEDGIVYVICATDIISGKHYALDKSVPSSMLSDNGILVSWKLAGQEIGGLGLSTKLPSDQESHNSVKSGDEISVMNSIWGTKPQKRRKQHFGREGNSLDDHVSSFSTTSQVKGWTNSQSKSEMHSNPLRRVFLPVYRLKKEDFICFSPFGITRLVKNCKVNERKGYKIVHTELLIASTLLDEEDLTAYWQNKRCYSAKESAFFGESIGCSFQGCLYLITQDGLFVVLPSVSVSSSVFPVDVIRYWQPSIATDSANQVKDLLSVNRSGEKWCPWQIEVLDRVLLFEGPEEAAHFCVLNGWGLKIARLRQMQLALQYLKSDEIEASLNMLVDINLAEEGILQLLFTSVYQIFCRSGRDSEVTLASRLMSLAARFATKMIQRYGILKHKKDGANNLRRLYEMAYFLEVIRNLQNRMAAKSKKLVHVLPDNRDARNMVETEELQDDSTLPIFIPDTASSGQLDVLEPHYKQQSEPNAPELTSDHPGQLVLAPATSANFHDFDENEAVSAPRKLITFENSKDMIRRWEIDNFDLETVVKDALNSGRLPLAVLQLHLLRQKELVSDKESQDMFSEVREIGRAIAYDLFIKGESGLAVVTLERLGDDIETVLRQLLFGTLRRSLRAQIVDEMKKHGYLRSHEWKTLEIISLIERLYPSSSFWRTFLRRQKTIQEAASTDTLSEADNPTLTFHVLSGHIIECDDIDGAVIGCWANVDSGPASANLCEDTNYAGYWACAAVWSDAWDERTVDRVILDQPFQMDVHIPWESQFGYHVSHNNMEEAYKLLDIIPTSLLSEGSLKINLDGSHPAANDQCDTKIPDYSIYICAAEEVEPVVMDVPDVRIFRSRAASTCTSWLKMLIEQKLARKYIFLQEYWQSTAEVLPLLACAGLIFKTSVKNESCKSSVDLDLNTGDHKETKEAVHKLFVHHCTRYNLPYLLDLYLDHHNLVQDYESLCLLMEAAGDCQWAKWLLFSRVKGCEYEASFSNARSNLSRQMNLSRNFSVMEIDEIVSTVDDMAESRGEMAALATLMYASDPMQKCLCSGSVNRSQSSSSQCTLENLKPGLQQFPTLWRTLVSACLEPDAYCSLSYNTDNVFGKSSLSDYLNWRYSIFSSTGGDTSLIQMIPCWFTKSIRRLVKLFVQGPFGWQSLSDTIASGESFQDRSNYYISNTNGNSGVSAISWEASIQKSIEEELYSSIEEKGFRVEHHLHRGRALAAFSHLLLLRASNLRLSNARQELSTQPNTHSDVQLILAPLTQSEGSFLLSVLPLAITHFDDSTLVASCIFLLELCGLSANMLRLDIAALQRISSYYKSVEQNAHCESVSPKGSALHGSHGNDFTNSLARALAEDYVHFDHLHILEQKQVSSKPLRGKQPSESVRTVLHHLEKASLPSLDEGKTCGSWLVSGIGDGSLFRSQQKDTSQLWNLVTAFCQMHHLPISTKYLALLANDNDWVGFLTEAQLSGLPIDAIIHVAAKEIKDSRLKTHILTVLRSMQSARKKTNSLPNISSSGSSEASFLADGNNSVSTELFGIIAECEKQKNPGGMLLNKAKDMRWSLLAMVASCFPDVSPLLCLTIWLEITAARETSLIKVDNISSKIAKNVGAAVEAINTLPAGSRNLAFRYNRKNSKRRRFLEHTSENSILAGSFSASSAPKPTAALIAEEIVIENERKKSIVEHPLFLGDSDEGLASLSNMVAVLCEQHLFLPLLRAFEMFLPSCSLLPFIRSLQAFSQMRLSDASSHLASFSARIKEEPFLMQINMARDGSFRTAWITTIAVKAADAVLSTCPSVYEKRCLLKLLAAADFADGGTSSAYFRRLYWKINLAEPSLRKDEDVYLGNDTLDDASLLTALEKNGRWEQARNWARQLESSNASWKSAVHHVTESQAEAMVVEWKEFLWDVPQERAALWGHCQALFVRYSFPPLQAGLFFLKHAEAIEKEIPSRELHEMLLLSLQWLSGTMTQSPPVYPLHLLREIETRVWLLAVESEAQSKVEGDFSPPSSIQSLIVGNSTSIIDQTANIIAKMDNHINATRMKVTDRNGMRENNQSHQRLSQFLESTSQVTATSSTRMKRRSKGYPPLRRPVSDNVDSNNDSDDYPNSPHNSRSSGELPRNFLLQEECVKMEASVSGWEQKVRPVDMEKAVLSLLEFGQITAAKQLQHKLSPSHVPLELLLIDVALKFAVLSSSNSSGEISLSVFDPEVLSVIQSLNIPSSSNMIDPSQALESLANQCGQGCGRGLCRRVIAVVKAAKVLGLSFAEAFEKDPIELLQLLSLKAQDSLEEAKLLVQTHTMPAPSIARILAESFLKGLLAAHRGGYIDSQKEEGPAPLLWRFCDFLKWAELCPSEPEIGHALMRLVMTGQDIPHACEVELLILSHHFYKSSACLDGVDVLVTLAANRVESYVLEGDFSCLARLITGVSNFHALNFILNILIENGKLDLLLQKYSAADAATGTAAAVRGFRMAVLTSLKLFNPHDLDAFAMVYNHFDMKHEAASLLESRSMQYMQHWLSRRDKDRQNEDLLEAMRHLIEAAEVLSTIDAGHKTHRACARASLLSLQIRIPDLQWIELSETNARRILVEQSRFQEALIVAEAYNLNQPNEWAPVLWNQMLRPDLIEQFVAEFVVVVPLQPSTLLEVARFYRAEVAARGDQSHFSVWLSPGGLPAEWVKHLGRSFRSLLKRTRDLRVRMQLATIATGFGDVIDACGKVLDKVPDNAGPLILRRGHGGAYLPLM
ncbi:uncharacterized protein [Typha latifolia]|uniref:uncharacterized protein isoform X1 n=1 Tax=Typha latifolia TaxID=4733 RepID=UPI003C2C78D2